MVVVSDSSPLVYLAVLADFALLPALYREILIPPAVWMEVVEQGIGFPVREAALQAAAEGWLKVVELEAPVAEPILISGHKLHLGEAQVIRLGEQLRADVLLIDDRQAVDKARSMGFRVVPTMAILIEAKRKGMIRSVKEKADRLRASRFHLAERDYQAVLNTASEL